MNIKGNRGIKGNRRIKNNRGIKRDRQIKSDRGIKRDWNIIRNIRFIGLLAKLKLSQSMVFRLTFFGAFFVDGSLFIMQLLMFNAIYSQVDTIGDWGRGQMLIFVGTFSLLNAINMTVYFFGVNAIPSKIKSGDLDHYLTKPINPLLRLTFESVNMGSFPLVFFSIGIILYGISVQGMGVSTFHGLLYLLFILLMALLYYDLEVILRTIPFFVVSASSIERLEGAMFDLCMRIPGVVFKGVFKLIFYAVLPYGLMATIPTQILTRSLSVEGMLYAAAVVIVFTFLTFWFWKFGLKHYKSASS